MRRVVLIALGAAAVAWVVSSRRRRPEDGERSGNGSAPAGSDDLRRFVEASERLRAAE